MQFHPKVSIIIPVYNGSNYLAEAIDSALAQTYKNIEVIVVNDGSNDNGKTEAIAKSYKDKIRYFYKPNGGVSTALNLGIEKMTGEYFSWLSHDDLYFPDKIESQIKFISRAKERKRIVLFGDYDLVNEESKTFKKVKIKKFSSSKIKLELIQSCPIHGCTMLIPKALFLRVGLFDEKLKTSQDYDLWFKMANHAKFIYMNKRLVKSRIHSEQGTRSMSKIFLKESEVLYQREVKNLFDNRDYAPIDLINCAVGLTEKGCFGAASLVMSHLSFKKFNPSIVKGFASYIYYFMLYKAVFAKQKLFPPKKRRPRSILLITPSFYPMPGGLSEQSFVLGSEFVRMGYKIDVLTEQLKKGLPRRESIDGMDVFRLSHIKNRNYLGLFRLAVRMAFFLLKNQSKYSFCIIRTISSHSTIAGCMKYLKLLRIRTFITAETGGENDEIKQIESMPLQSLITFFLSKNDFINSNNEGNTKHYLELGIPKHKITKIYNGIDTSSYNEAIYPKKIRKFIFLAELNASKGIQELLEAFRQLNAKFPDTKLSIGGFGKMKGYIKKFISENKLSKKLFFEGYISKKKKVAFFQNGDCFVFPSYSEGFGIVTAEAIKYKRLLITTRVADLEKIYGNQVLYCNIKDAGSLLSSMTKAIEQHDEKFMNYDEIIQKIDIRTTARDIDKLFI